MMCGNVRINGRHGCGDDGATKRKAWWAPWVLLGSAWSSVWLLWQAGMLAAAALLFHQGVGGFWAGAVVGCGISAAFGIVRMGILRGFCLFDCKSPQLAWLQHYVEDDLDNQRAFAFLFACFQDGICMAIVWEIVLVLSGWGFVESTFGVVAVFLGVYILVSLVWGVVVGCIRAVLEPAR